MYDIDILTQNSDGTMRFEKWKENLKIVIRVEKTPDFAKLHRNSKVFSS